MKWLEMILFMSWAFVINILGIAIFVGTILGGYYIDIRVKQNHDILNPFEIFMLITSAFLLFLVSIRVSMYGDKLSKKLN